MLRRPNTIYYYESAGKSLHQADYRKWGGIIKRFWIILLVIIILISAAGILSAKTIHTHYVKYRLVPTQSLQLASDNMAGLTGYRFHLESGFTVEQREEVISKVDGEKADGNTHIKGEMVNTPVDIYYINRTIYNYDSFADKWLVIESETNNSEELLVSELNPLSNFRMKALGEVEKIGFEKVDGAECLVVRCQPTVESQLLESMWKEFDYQFWIDYQHNLIRKATLTAKNQQNDQTSLKLTVHFYDFDNKIVIKPPDSGS